MIGILLITHGTVGEALIQSVSYVLNKRPEYLAHVGVAPQEDSSEILPAARAALLRVDQGQGALILADMWGATPSNVAVKLLEPGRVAGVAGVNMPMLLRALTYRERDLETLVTRAVAGGRDGVMRMDLI
jgi:mannose PTS system EIIA component